MNTDQIHSKIKQLYVDKGLFIYDRNGIIKKVINGVNILAIKIAFQYSISFRLDNGTSKQWTIIYTDLYVDVEKYILYTDGGTIFYKGKFDEFYNNYKDSDYMFNLSLLCDTSVLDNIINEPIFYDIINLIKES